ncbi:alpha-galactosidase [Microbacterium betulae]|uniref:Alpha-galactosidase n=1 Tax=Microbacterium betulae TaxID=2981139 RepID=A0AA97FI97_9MICO|nr:alpha-galactosidase [Microbacterium sp. AB]WOF23545.1 alpha-galactosidase [Microbacterium sp. AB]
MSPDARTVQLRAAGVALVLDVPAAGAPRVIHWGADPGPLSDADVDALRLTGLPGIGSGMPDSGMPLTLLPAHAEGWLWTPGIAGHRDGTAFSPVFTGTTARLEPVGDDPLIAQRVRIASADEENGLRLALHVEMTRSGLVRTRAELTNTGEGVYDLASLDIALPVPGRATELLDMAGRQLRERELQRSPFTIGSHLRESRRSSGHEASVILAAGTPGFGWRHGEVWAVHPAWSGNTRALAERNNMGMSTLGGGELLLPGEVRLAQDETYVSPWLYASTGVGLDAMSARFHDFLRARPRHPGSARPVTLNVWEAVYFDHDLDRLLEIADRAAEIGVERYVLDDGWFRHRRDDTAGLGDWYVDEGVWPDGLHPLTDAVTARGMQFGLWFEPEMVNEDSDLARAHPEWIMGTGPRLPHPQRHQQVLNLTVPEAYAHIRDRILALLDEYPISYIKWDHNRALTEPGDRTTGRPIAHEQVEALYRLLDEIRAAHPGLEIESCASGGGRIDLGIMARTDRVWGSDCIDPLERQQIEAGTALLLPPEMVGSHVASPVSHTTGRAHSLGFRAGTAFFSHMGVEWDVTKASDADRAALAEWIALHKRHRALLHTGRVVHADEIGDGLWTHGVVAQDGEEAIFAVAAVRTGPSWPTARVTLPGLDAGRRYRLTSLAPADASDRRTAHTAPAWWPGPVELPGAVLGQIGVQVPALNPEQLVLLHLTAV